MLKKNRIITGCRAIPDSYPKRGDTHMCGRYTLTVNIKTIAEKFGVEPTLETEPRYNVAPTQNVVSIMRNGTTHLADRKSTRLNSSHRTISYAVFCLKK